MTSSNYPPDPRRASCKNCAYWRPAGSGYGAGGDAEGFAVDHPSVVDALRKIDAVWDELYPGEQTRAVSLLVDHIEVGLDRVTMTMKARGVEHLLGAEVSRTGQDGFVEVVLPVVCRRRSGRTRVINETTVVENNTEERNEVLEAIARGFVWMEEIESGKIGSVSALADREGVDEAYVRRMLGAAMHQPFSPRESIHSTLRSFLSSLARKAVSEGRDEA